MRIFTYDLSKVMAGTVAPSTIEDCIEAFEDLGHKVVKIEIAALGDTPQERLKGLEVELVRERPDFVFTLNDYCLTPELLTRLRIPYVSWFGDDPAQVMEKRFPSHYYTIFVCDRAYIEGLKEAGFEDVYYLPYGSNPSVFRDVELSQEDRERYGCNISFAGSSFYFAIKKYHEITDNNKELKGIVDEVIEIQAENPTIEVSDILKGVEEIKGCSISYKDQSHKRQIEIWLEYTAMARYRQDIVRGLGEFGLNLFGDDGWIGLLRDGDRQSNGIRFCGWANNRTDLVKIYNASKINLNISKSQARTTLPMRVFDISCAGGFLLTDFRESLPEFFDIDEEVVCFRSKDEVKELARYFLSHPREREEIARAAQKRVLSCHTFVHRMGTLLNTMIDRRL